MAQETALVETIAAGFLARREEVADEMVERIRDAVTEVDALELWEAVRASCLANLETGLGALADDRALPDSIPADARDLALVAARLDVPLAALLRTYRVGHLVMWRAWAAAVEAKDAEPDVRRAALDAGSEYLFEYVDRLATLLTDAYTAERERFVRSREQRRTQLVRDVLEGTDPDAAEAMRLLDYDLRLEHLALLVSGPDVDAVVRELARELDAPHRLVVSLTGDTAWAWLGRTRPFRIPERIDVGAGAVVSIGDPGAGPEGFRRSHRQARDAHSVAVRGYEADVVRYDDVALESLLGADEARAGAFIARELRGLDGSDERSARLRATLRAYFATGQNASAAAAMLGVHEHTVSYRLRTIEERLGRPVTARRAELETALRLFDLHRS
jgi:hypothetical protein